MESAVQWKLFYRQWSIDDRRFCLKPASENRENIFAEYFVRNSFIGPFVLFENKIICPNFFSNPNSFFNTYMGYGYGMDLIFFYAFNYVLIRVCFSHILYKVFFLGLSIRRKVEVTVHSSSMTDHTKFTHGTTL